MTSSVRFTEEMLGHVTFGESDFARGAQPDRDGSRVASSSTSRSRSSRHRALRQRPAAPGRRRRLRAVRRARRQAAGRAGRGSTCSSTSRPGVKHMLYRLWFRDGVGHPLTMTGFKLVENDAGFDVWKDTTTLFTRVLQGHVDEGDDDAARAGRVRRSCASGCATSPSS